MSGGRRHPPGAAAREEEQRVALEATDGVGRITPIELDGRLHRGDRLAVLDVRRREAWTASPPRVPGATWLPLEEVPERVRDLPRETDLVVYCD